MMAAEIAADVFLALAVLVVFLSSVGVLVMGNAYDKLHFVGPAAIVAPIFVAIAVLIRQGVDENSVQTWLAVGFMVVAGPFLSHATIRAVQVRETGDWRPWRQGDAPPDEQEAPQ